MKIHLICGLVAASFILVQCVTSKPLENGHLIYYYPLAASSPMKEKGKINDEVEMRLPIVDLFPVRKTNNVLDK